MKRTTIHISAALALLLGLAACTQDEAGFLPEGAEGTPIVFTATGLNPDATATAGTRATVDGDWEGVQSVAVLMDGTVKAYDVTPSTSDNTGATLTSTDPHYWTNHDNITVTAWWPYTAGETTPPAVKVAADQSARKDFEGSDLIVAEEQTVSYGNPTLRFTHGTARVTVVLTDYTEEQMFVRLTGLSTENGNPAVIAPYDKGGDTYTALVAPQTVATGTAFITCKFTNGKVFVYKMKNDTDWQAGEEYTYTVSLAAAKDPGYTVSEDGKTYTVYTADGLLAWNKAVQNDLTLNCTLTADITLTGEWTPIGTDYKNSYTGTFDGGNHTISGLTVKGSDENAGLFGYIGKDGGTVKNVVLENVQITSDYQYGYVGGVAGYSRGNIENCSVSGSVSSRCTAGGVVGQQFGGSITLCGSSATVKGTGEVGGVAGKTDNSATLTACYATGNVTFERASTINTFAGGVVGSNGTGSILTACYATVNVTGTGTGTGSCYVGGVTGDNASGTLTACYHATGTVSGPDGATGGVTGRNYTSLGAPVITACYWGDNGQEQGIGYNQAGTIGGTEQVTDGNWQNAANAMNAALNAESWRYTFEPGNSLPLLVQNP
ncbi:MULTISPECIES: fimbrillin family protein [Bacteroidales]|uniref:Fimbrillin family protein n=1 Tax=Marseilla massiliensis TaxID=1841864 RepID=A0A938WNF8_9BACT|nr:MULTISPECIES: fimbrillin family protein [Bacteroidales]MBM6661394.1 fimbrillin family protein [Marseilla massiliensis]MBM6718609.1 fimbrillin family protein [Bacteroides gallinaceum]